MADPVSYGISERDIGQALIALKKGTHLIKYSRQGKPKFCPFRISSDESTLIWYSHGEERNLKFSSVSRIIPGQRTAVFRRYLRPEKDYLSFSLIYNSGERSLDLICKDSVETEVWFTGLKALISTDQCRNRHTKSDIPDLNVAGDFIQNGRPFGAALDFTSSIVRGRTSIDLSSRESSARFSSSDVGTERANMQLRTSTGDGFRVSISSTPSTSSQGSGPDDIESLGDVYVWGEIWSDGVSTDGSSIPFPIKTDVLNPKPLESSVVLDVHQIACGVRHFSLVTRQGEVFTWGEESGGRLGHGIDRDFSCPRLVEYLAVTNMDSVACGEYHTCAVSSLGDVYSWGDGFYNAGLLGNGTDVSHWIPKRVSGPLEGLQVLSVACGSWHTAVATSNGKLFTFGDGTFGVLGHGDRESVTYPREVQLLNGLKTIKVACGVWHTAAIVEVTSQSSANVSPRKLFTWGDGDKHRLGHGNKETYLLPTCVSSLIDYNVHQIACGHSMTVALTTSGHVFTMGGTMYGQLGNPMSNGVLPSLVQDRLVGEFVEEISCGAYHVAVLTSRSEVFTWGSGANGRLGHGDTEDQKYPTLVETLKDRHVKNISCGSNFTASICIHKWVSGADQSVCSGCRQAFGFTRKRHNCYNCGLVHCHACSSRKALRAALAPTPGKPHRVCDSCYAKLKASEAGSASNFCRRTTTAHHSIDSRDRLDRGEVRSSRTLLSPITDPVKYLGVKSVKPGIRSSQAPSLLQPKDNGFSSPLSALQNALKPSIAPTTPPPTPPHPSSSSRSSSPYPRRPSPTRSATLYSRSVVDSLKKTNEFLKQEVENLQNKVKTLKQKSHDQDFELQSLQKKAQQAALLARQEFSNCRVAKDVIKFVATQLKEISEKFPPDVCESEVFKEMHGQIEKYLNTNGSQGSEPPSSPPNLNHRRTEEHVDAVGVTGLSQNGESMLQDSSSIPEAREAPQRNSEINSQSSETSTSKSRSGKEIIEQFEPGVYVICLQLRNGVKMFQRVRFSKRRFQEQQAEEWWNENKDRVLKKYGYKPSSISVQSETASTPPSAEDINEAGPSSQT